MWQKIPKLSMPSWSMSSVSKKICFGAQVAFQKFGLQKILNALDLTTYYDSSTTIMKDDLYFIQYLSVLISIFLACSQKTRTLFLFSIFPIY